MLNLHLSSGLIIYGVPDYKYRSGQKWLYVTDSVGHDWAIKPEHIIASEVIK